jgi:hypothetical protein
MNIESVIRDANPVNSADLPGADAPEARWLLHGILQAPASEHWSARPRRRPRGLVLSVAAGAAAAAAGATALAAGLLPGPAGTALPGAGGGHPQAATVAALYKLSRVAARQPNAGPPGPGQFQYTSSVGAGQACAASDNLYACWNLHDKREIWIGPDGSGRIRESQTDPTFATAKDRENWIEMGRPARVGPPSDEKYGPGGLSTGPADLSKLPTDPAQLAELISSRKIEGGPPGPAEDFVQVGDLLRETAASPELRAALFKVAAGIPGVKLLGTVTDSDGRSGTAIAFVSSASNEPTALPSPVPAASAGSSDPPSAAPSGSPSPSPSGSPSPSASPGPGGGSQGTVLNELIFDPGTSGLLAEQTVRVHPDGSTQLVVWSDYLLSGVVDSVSDVPPSSSVP